MPRTFAANHTRPLSSNMALCWLALVSHRISSPQYAEGCVGLMAPAWPGPSESGMFGSATGILKYDTL